MLGHVGVFFQVCKLFEIKLFHQTGKSFLVSTRCCKIKVRRLWKDLIQFKNENKPLKETGKM